MKKLTEIESNCGYLIHITSAKAAATAGSAAIIPLPGVPLVAIPALMGLEINLTMRIAKEFGENITKAVAKGVAGSCGCTVVGVTAALGLTSVINLPGVNVAINGTIAAGVVEVFGWTVFNHYKNKYLVNCA